MCSHSAPRCKHASPADPLHWRPQRPGHRPPECSTRKWPHMLDDSQASNSAALQPTARKDTQGAARGTHQLTGPPATGLASHRAVQTGDFQPFASHGPHKLITKILQHTKKYGFCQSGQENRYNWFIHTGQLLLCWLLSVFKIWQSKGNVHWVRHCMI